MSVVGTPFQSEALKGASAEAAREQADFIAAVTTKVEPPEDAMPPAHGNTHALAQLRRLYLHALHGGVVTADDLSGAIQIMERAVNDLCKAAKERKGRTAKIAKRKRNV